MIDEVEVSSCVKGKFHEAIFVRLVLYRALSKEVNGRREALTGNM